MNDEMRTEAMELCVTACEKFSANNEVCWAYSLSDLLLLGNHMRTAGLVQGPILVKKEYLSTPIPLTHQS